MSVRSVKATENNIDVVFELVEEFYDYVNVQVRDDRETIKHHYLEGGQHCGIWIAFVDDVPAGCVILRPLENISEAGEVKRMYVRDSFRGKGVAQALMTALEEYAMDVGLKTVYLDTKDDLKAAIRFYEQSGYMRCERYNENPQATIFMKKAL
jgi:GNAT superfamily N-acetyltransferase